MASPDTLARSISELSFSGAAVTSATVEASLAGSTEGATVQAAEQGNTAPAGGGTENTLNRVAQDVNPPTVVQNSNDTRGGGTTSTNTTPTRDAPSETTGTSTPTPRTGQFTVVIRRP